MELVDHRRQGEIDCVVTGAGGELHGDVLEAVVSLVSVLDLLPASLVSKTWRGAVLSSLRHSPRRVPCLLVHHINTRRRAAVTTPDMAAATYAYDPLSRTWSSVPGSQQPPASGTLANELLRGAHSGAGLYALNTRSLAVSVDPFGTAWRVTDAPNVWRTDPVVAAVGTRVVVAGGACEFEDEERAVEVHREDGGGGWQACDSMPEVFRDSAWAAWLSVATSDQRLYVLEKNTTAEKDGWASCFDPESGRWGPTRKLRLPGDGDAVPVAIGYAKGVDRLVVVGVAGGRARGQPAAVTLWAADGRTLEVQEEIGRMPPEMAEEVAADERAVGFSCEWGFGYFYKKSVWSSTPKEFFAVEFGKGAGGGESKKGWRCRWERVPSPPEILREELMMRRVVIGCSLLGSGVELKTVLPPAPTGRTASEKH